MSSKGSSPAGNTTQISEPAPYAQPYAQQGLQQAASLYATGGPKFYPGQQVAPFSPLQEQGFSQIQNQANAPNTINQTGSNYYNALESGQYLNPQSNPALQGLVNQSDQQIQNNLASQFAGAGRNIEASAPVQASQMAQVANDIYGGAYNNTLNNMTGALGQGNSLIAGQYLPAQQLLGAGGQIQQQAQNLIQGNENAYNFYQQQPYQNLANYMNEINAAGMGQQVQTPYFTNPTAGALGGALGGAEVGTSIMPGWGTAIGALGGGLLGLMGSGG